MFMTDHPRDLISVAIHFLHEPSVICSQENAWSSIVIVFPGLTTWGTAQLPLAISVIQVSERVQGKVLVALIGEAVSVLSTENMEHANMVANASTSMRNPENDLTPLEAVGQAPEIPFTPHGVDEAHRGPPIGRTGHRSHAGFTKRVTARGATNARLNMKEHHHQLPHLRVKEPVLRPPNQSESVAAIAEARGVGVPMGKDVAEEVGTRRGQGNHLPETRVPRIAQVHHAFNSHVLSSKMTTGKSPKPEMWWPDSTSTAEMPRSILPTQSVHSLSGCCQIHAGRLTMTRMVKTYASRTIGGHATAKKVMRHGLAKLYFASSRNTKVQCQLKERNLSKFHLTSVLKPKHFMLIMTCLNMNMWNSHWANVIPKHKIVLSPRKPI